MELGDLWMVHPEPSGSVLFYLTPVPPSGRMMELEDLWMVHPEPSGSVLFCLTPVPPQVV